MHDPIQDSWDAYQYARITMDLASDPTFWGRIQLALSINGKPDAAYDADPLNPHRGELCDCGHEAGAHEAVDEVLLACTACTCQGFSDGILAW